MLFQLQRVYSVARNGKIIINCEQWWSWRISMYYPWSYLERGKQRI